MTLQAFFQIPIVKFFTHVFLVVSIVLNIWQIYRYYDMQLKIENQTEVLSILKQENNDARNQRDYFTSDLYKERYAKEQNFRVNGESVISTAVIETQSNPQKVNFIPNKRRENQSNAEKWFDYVFKREVE